MERLDRRVLALVAVARESDHPVVIPAGVVAQVWRDDRRQVPLARFLRARETIVDPLDLSEARAAGVLCGRTGTDDVIDASVVLSAARRGHARVITSDRSHLQRIDGDLRVIEC
jgi:hypothetical protein